MDAFLPEGPSAVGLVSAGERGGGGEGGVGRRCSVPVFCQKDSCSQGGVDTFLPDLVTTYSCLEHGDHGHVGMVLTNITLHRTQTQYWKKTTCTNWARRDTSRLESILLSWLQITYWA